MHLRVWVKAKALTKEPLSPVLCQLEMNPPRGVLGVLYKGGEIVE